MMRMRGYLRGIFQGPIDLWRRQAWYQAGREWRALRQAGLRGVLQTGPLCYATERGASFTDWIARNETWDHIQRYRLVPRGLLKSLGPERSPVPSEISAVGEQFMVHVPGEWAYELAHLYLDPTRFDLHDMVWSLRILRSTDFQDLSLSFRMSDYENRRRFRFEGGRLSFDRFAEGHITNNLATVPCALTTGRSYQIEIRAWRDVFSCYVDGTLRLCRRDPGAPGGTVAVTCWDGSSKQDIGATIGPMTIHSLQEAAP